jgi:hypothetical protein
MMIMKLYRDKSVQFLFVLGALLSSSYLVNAIPVFDDMAIPAAFSTLVEQHGYFKTVGMLLTRMDMPNEYRTYGLSLALQFGIWAVAGGQSFLFPLIIALSQLGTGVLLLLLLRERGVDEPMSLAVATAWLISPFAVNWCFHHYTYLILPFQIVVATCLVLGRVTTAPYRHVLAALLGVACALTGELQLITGPAALLFAALSSRDKERLRLSYLVIGAMIVTLITHRWFWGAFIQSTSQSQRFEVTLPSDHGEILQRAFTALTSIPKSAEEQFVGIVSSGFGWGLLIGVLTGLAYWIATIVGASTARSNIPAEFSDSRSAPITEWKLALAFLGVAFASLGVYLVLSTLTGQMPTSMPRRYGFVPLTLLLIVFVIGTAIASKAVGISRRFAMAVAIGLVAALAGQLHVSAIPSARAADAQLTTLLIESGGLRKNYEQTGKGVLFFVSTDPQYLSAVANNSTVGPKMDSHVGIELLESPFGAYWTTQRYSTHILGYRFAAIPKRKTEEGTIEVGGNPYPANPGRIVATDVVVVANLGFNLSDPKGENVRVFRSFNEFEPYFFGRGIKRDALEMGGVPFDEFVIDMGRIEQSPRSDLGGMPDKKFADAHGPISKAWVKNYGLLSGQDSVYTHPHVSDNFAYYRTNRHGVFTYGVTFHDVGAVEINLDFWEQWGHQPGVRVFELEVSWDGYTWASVGAIDPAGLNGHKPLSIVLTKANPKVFQFRMKPIAGAKDIPMIQGLRIRRLRTFN